MRERLAELGDIGAAVALLTRLPAPRHRPRGARAAWAWPLVGAVVGLLAAAVAVLALWTGLAPGVAAGLALATQVLLTGALHEDGLADCADGFWGGGTPARRVAIMADSRIGTYGAVALILTLGLRWQALATILGAGAAWGPLVAVAALSRWPMAAVLWALPPAREGGLARLVGRPGAATLALAAGLAVALSAVLIGWAVLPLVLLVTATTVAWIALARARIGGQTGDVCGTAQQLGETAALLTLAALG